MLNVSPFLSYLERFRGRDYLLDHISCFFFYFGEAFWGDVIILKPFLTMRLQREYLFLFQCKSSPFAVDRVFRGPN